MERLTNGKLKGVALLNACGSAKCKVDCKQCILLDEAIEKLKAYEDAEEQGLLLRLPCKVGDIVWYLDKYDYEKPEVVSGVVDGYLWFRSCGFALDIVWNKPIMGHFLYLRKEMLLGEIGKTLFLTKEEAEQKLAEMQKE